MVKGKKHILLELLSTLLVEGVAAKAKMRHGREPTCRWAQLPEFQRFVSEVLVVSQGLRFSWLIGSRVKYQLSDLIPLL